MVAAETGLGSGGDGAADMVQVQKADVCTVMSSMMDKSVEEVREGFFCFCFCFRFSLVLRILVLSVVLRIHDAR